MNAKNFIPYGCQSIDETDIEAVAKALRSGWLTTGPLVDSFEEAVARKVGARHCVVFNSGTAALHGAYNAAGIGPGDEVITSPVTFAATANAALYLGAKPIFVDIAPESFHLDPKGVEAAITSRTRAIVPVDMAGIPAPLDEITSLAAKNNLLVVEDGCHAIGAIYKGRKIGSIAGMTAFSFHPVKHITTGEGGAVTTDNEEMLSSLRIFRSHGIVRDKKHLSAASAEEVNSGPWYHEQQVLGYNYRLPDINCALGLSQLKRLDYFLERRRAIAARYNEAFRDNHCLVIPPEPFGRASVQESAWHLYILRLAGKAPLRRRLLERLYDRGIGTQVHYIPVYRHPYYRSMGYRAGLCPRAEEYYRCAFTIPLFPAMSDDDVERVIVGVNEEVEAVYRD